MCVCARNQPNNQPINGWLRWAWVLIIYDHNASLYSKESLESSSSQRWDLGIGSWNHRLMSLKTLWLIVRRLRIITTKLLPRQTDSRLLSLNGTALIDELLKWQSSDPISRWPGLRIQKKNLIFKSHFISIWQVHWKLQSYLDRKIWGFGRSALAQRLLVLCWKSTSILSRWWNTSERWHFLSHKGEEGWLSLSVSILKLFAMDVGKNKNE